MTHPNFQTNGASLEDCHTNFFALTELSGIKWRKLVWSEADRNGGGGGGGGVGHHGPGGGSGGAGTEPLEDPVLRSFARCLAADILCVWRRVSTPRANDNMFDLGPPPPAQPPPLSLAASKELWIFWYGEEPDLNDLVAPELNTSGYCGSSSCDSKIKIHIHKEEYGSNVTLRCEATKGDPTCFKTRQLRQPTRDQVVKELKEKSVEKFRSDQARSFKDIATTGAPHLYSGKVLRTAVSQKKASEHLDADPIKALGIMKRLTAKGQNTVRNIGYDPTFVHFWSAHQTRLYNEKIQRENVPLIIDSTGKIAFEIKHAGNVKSQHLFLYLGVINCQAGQFSVVQQISEKQNTVAVHNWLMNWIHSGAKYPKEVICDESRSLLTACVWAFTRQKTIEEYANACSDVNHLPECYIRLDVAHYLRKYVRFLKAAGVKRLSKTFIMGAIGEIIMCLDEKEAKDLIKCILLITSSPTMGTETPTLNAAYIKLKERMTGETKERKDMQKFIDSLFDEKDEPENELKKDEFGSIGTNNKWKTWGKEILKMVFDIIEKEKGDDDNPRAVKNFSKYFLKDVELLPLWSCISRKNFGYGRIPASSAPVESEFNKVKNHVLRGKTRLDDAVETLIDYYFGRMCIVDANEQPREEKKEKSEMGTSHYTNLNENTDNFTTKEMQLDETILEQEEHASFVPIETPSTLDLKKKYSSDSDATSFVYSEYSAEDESDHYKHNTNVHSNELYVKIQSEPTSRRPLQSFNNINIKCIACQNEDYPSDAHQCFLCQTNVHILPGCSELIGKEERHGEKRICIDCFNTPRLDERLSMKYNENWMNLGNSPKKRKREKENIFVEEIENSQKALYLGQSKEKLKEALTFVNCKSIPVLQNGGNDELKFVNFPEKVKVSLTNTCAHDSIFQIILAAATDYNEIEVFLRKQENKCALFKEVLYVLEKGITAKVYNLRASILLDFKQIQPQESSTTFVDCADNIGTMSRFLFENVPSFIEGFQCPRGCKPRNIKLPIYGIKKTMAVSKSFESVIKNHVQRQTSSKCIAQDCSEVLKLTGFDSSDIIIFETYDDGNIQLDCLVSRIQDPTSQAQYKLADCEQGSWESGLSYECRSLLFKALHNLIERCLLSRDFIRLGKWFVQPCTGSPKRGTGLLGGGHASETAFGNAHLSFSFAFFVHGESSVCASVDVRQHPPVRRLSRWNVQQAQASSTGLKVILAPFGLSGTLTGHSFKSPEVTARILEDWSQFYPLDKSNTLNDSNLVEVLVGEVKMMYPSCYVLVTDMDDEVNSTVLNGLSTVSTVSSSDELKDKRSTSPVAMIQTPPPSPVKISSRVPQPGPYAVSVEHLNSMSREPTVSTVLAERTWQECILGNNNNASEREKEFTGNWDFVEPTRKTNCTCSKCRKTPIGSNKWTTGGGTGTHRSSGKTGRARVPFHRRSPFLPLLPSERCSSGSYTPQGGPPSYPRTQESTAIPSVGTPPSVAPSPLPNPHSQQPASVPPGDQTMPTLSPHPPTEDTKTHTPEQPPKSISPANSPNNTQNAPNEVKNESPHSTPNYPLLRKPVLSSKEYEVALGEEEQPLEMLYDYSTMDAWLNHPVKKFKPDGKENQRLNRIGKTDIYSLYDKSLNNQANEVVNINNNNNNSKSQIKTEIKQEIVQTMETDTTQITHPHGIKRPGDPYEFEEDGGSNLDTFKRGQVTVKEENKEVKKITTETLFTSEGLQPSYKDLDRIFDNSDDDDGMQVQTPPGSTTINHHDDSKRFPSHGCPTMGILGQAELSKMFPTPPSLEHNPIASPCGQLDLPTTEFSSDLTIVRVKQEIYPNMGSPQEENIEDWSYVFKPPTICKMVGSSKYAPLTNLPSQNLPPVTLPSNSTYKPSWMQHVENKQQSVQQQSTNTTNTTTTNQNNTNTSTNQNSIFPPSPLLSVTPNSTGTNVGVNTSASGSFRPPPPPYEMASPATSTASSYLNKNLNSVEAAPTPNPSLSQRTPEASSLVLNILLTDTAFNIFRDHNFDSCTLCVCNAAGKVVGNIRGADAGIYLLNTPNDKQHASAQPSSPYPNTTNMGQPPPYGNIINDDHHNDEDSIRCSCGFSAIVNRRLAHGSGLFYEDEHEITGIAEDPGEKKKPSLLSFLVASQSNQMKSDPSVDREQIDVLPHSLIELVREQLVFIPNSTNSLCKINNNSSSDNGRSKVNHNGQNNIHILEYTDSHDVTCIALEQSKNFLENMSMCKMEELKQHTKSSTNITVHRWPFIRAKGPQCNQDIVRVMRSLQPLLQEAIQKKCQTRLWEAPSAVKGPLTWRQFHRLAGRGTDDRCEPQPIPSIVVGHDKDWLSLSPYALQHWETLLLEPYSYARDVAYVVVAPDNEAILPRVRTFFRELSTAYEMCKLGRHSPITKVLRDGILRVGKTAKNKIGNEPVEEWFTLLGEGETTDMLKLYAQVCKHHLAPHLQQVPMDKTLLDPPQELTTDQPTPSPMPPPSTPENITQSSTPTSGTDKTPTPKSDESDNIKDSSPVNNVSDSVQHDEDDQEVPSIVVYLVEPFSLGSDQPELQRLAVLALLRCYQSVLTAVPETIRNNISVQIISLESVVELNKARNRNRHSDHMRALALNIFSQCRRLLVHTNNVKSLTGFGTAAMADHFLKNKDEKNRAPYKVYTPPYILAPLRGKQEPADAFTKGAQEQSSVLYISYCLSEDQSWLLAVATDEKGEIFETITINVDIPNRSRRKKASARRFGLEKLMSFILGVMSQNVRPWRLVVGRLGRIGHGELKGWSWLLSRKNLLKSSKHLKEICNQCAMMYPSSVPCILSACLVSLEPDSVLRLMPDQFTPDERFSQVSVNSQLSTPQDVSCTHILVFPTSATTQSSQTAFQEQHITAELGDDELFSPFDDMPEGMEGEFNDIFNWTEIAGNGGGQSPTGSPRREESGTGSPTGGANMGRDGTSMIGMNSKGLEPSEEVGVVLQQPLALGFFVSTAPTGKMPRWFWSSCPHLEGVCPAFLKNALHLHSPNVQQSSDDLFQQSAVTSHPLDSQFTTDVLRYVLEGYNALSWLALDSNTKDRLSCLPVHMQVLVQLYNTAAALL